MDAFRTRDRDLLRRFLARDPIAAAYLLGDLDDAPFPDTEWLAAGAGGRLQAVLLVYRALSVPVLLSHGDAEGVTAVFDAFHDSLPDRCYAKIPAGHEAPFLRHYRMEQAERLLVMGLRRHEFRPAPPVCQVRRLDSGIAIDRVLAVFRAYPGHFFESSQLVTGVYVGGFEGEELVSVAGTHVFSPAQGLAVLGNIVTLRRARGRGYASACVSRLIEELDEAGCRTIALHVAEVNLAALACYRRTGFTVRGEVHQLDLSKSGL